MNTEYSPWFVVLWGGLLEWSILDQNIMQALFIFAAMAILHSHEYAHALEAERRGVPVEKILFTWWGGAVMADLVHPHDAVAVIRAGLYDTLQWAAITVVGVIAMRWLWWEGMLNMASPWVNLWATIAVFASAAFFANALPIRFGQTRIGVVATDGWAWLAYRSVVGEFWNRPAEEYRESPDGIRSSV